MATAPDLAAAAAGLLAFMAKALVLALFVAVLESHIAKFRFFRLPDLLFTSFVLSVIAISLAI
jgi:formate hydrogenlyase subunit 4